MNIFEPVVRGIQSLTNNFGITIIICILVDVIAVLPFKILKRKNDKKKALIAPKIKELQNKYHINALGPYKDDDDTLDPEIRELDLGQRQAEMNKEVSAEYKRVKYHAFIGWIPSLVTIAITIIIYFGVSAACPEGSIYAMRLQDIKNAGLSSNIFGVVIIVAEIVSAVILGIITQVFPLIKKKKEGKKVDGVMIGTAVFGVLFPLGIAIWISTASIIATITMICIIQWIGFIEALVHKQIEKSKSAKNNNEKTEVSAS